MAKNYFGNQFQSSLNSTLKEKTNEFNNIVHRALLLPNGVDEFDFKNTSYIIAYKAVTDSNGNRIGILFVTIPNIF